MVLDLKEAPPLLLAPITHDVRRITDPDQIGAVVAVQEAVWQEERSGTGELSQPDNARGSGDSRRVCGLCRWTDRFVGLARFQPPSPFAGLWGGSTLPAYRKQGFYTALVAVRVQEALRRGARFLTIDASPMSRPIVERFGFQYITTAFACNWHHAELG